MSIGKMNSCDSVTVCPSVRLSVTCRDCLEAAKHIIKLLSSSHHSTLWSKKIAPFLPRDACA